MKYDKEYFQKQLYSIVSPAKAFYTKEKSGLKVGVTGTTYDDKRVEMEGFSRMLWGLAPLWAGDGDIDGFAELYREGIEAGCDRQSPGYWGELTDFDQKFVELASVSLGFIIAPDKLWEPLSEETKDNLASYMLKINEHKVGPNNWVLFPVLINVALKCVGKSYSKEAIEKGLSALETFYLGNGWYSDGVDRPRDYYVSFALHFYSLIYSKACYDYDRERCEKYKARAAEFAKDYIYWFDEKGRSIVYGRSLIYRFAHCAFWSACLFADVDVFNYGIVKGIIGRHLDEWLENPIFDNAGLLTIGYRYPNLQMSDCYNAPGSPYWSLKAFLFLALPDSHPFWQAEALKLPKLQELKYLKEADMLIQHNKKSSTMLTGGFSYNPNIKNILFFEKYCKFAYSSEFGFSVPRTNASVYEMAADSMLSFEIAEFNTVVRGFSKEIKVSENEIYSHWSPFPGIDVKTTIRPTEKGHIRYHEITSDIECTAHDAGFAVARTDNAVSQAESGVASVKNDFSYCVVKNENNMGEAEVYAVMPNTSLVYQRTFIPMITYKIPKGTICIETLVEYL